MLKVKKERIRRYRRYVYRAGAVNQPEKEKARVIDGKVLEKERNRGFGLIRTDCFKYPPSKKAVKTNYGLWFFGKEY